jgi:methionyl aminopeptidase
MELIAAVEAALRAAIAAAGPHVPILRLSAAIEAAIATHGFRPMRNLCGHHLGRWTVHCPPPVPNFADGTTAVLAPGAVFAIEPFATTGAGIASERGHAEVFRLRGDPGDISAIDDRLRETLIRRNGLPFSRRDLDSLPEQTVEEGLASLLAQGALAAYPPLVELTGHPVAQAEHTLLVTDREVVVLTA